MRDPRLTEQRNPRSMRIDEMEPLEIVELMNAEDRLVAEAVGKEAQAIARALTLAEDAFRRGGADDLRGGGHDGQAG